MGCKDKTRSGHDQNITLISNKNKNVFTFYSI